MMIAETVQKLKEGATSGWWLDLKRREAHLEALLKCLDDHEEAILEALHLDLGKCAFEGYATDLLSVKMEIRHARKNLRRWAKRRRIPTKWYHWPGSASLEWRPHGVALILGAWNYPVQLTLVPLVDALAAGNSVLLKPSEGAPHTAAVLESILSTTLPPEVLAVCNGGPEVAKAALESPVDLIFYTGGGSIGKLVAASAARRLIPYVLELGGKNPCIVAPDAPMELTAKRIVWAKFLNAGQTCIAPDHVWVPRLQLDQWTAAFSDMIRSFYGSNPTQSPDYGKIATPRHHQRLTEMLTQGRIVSGGRWNATTRFFEPTLMTDPTPGSALAEEEIFGPILPILPYDTREELAAQLQQKESPLSFYVHTASAEEERFWLDRVKAGAISFNEHIVHSTVPDLPFGGVGSSGVGHYHGRPGFEAFSRPLPIYRQPSKIDLPLRYPPFGKRLRWIKQLLG